MRGQMQQNRGIFFDTLFDRSTSQTKDKYEVWFGICSQILLSLCDGCFTPFILALSCHVWICWQIMVRTGVNSSWKLNSWIFHTKSEMMLQFNWRLLPHISPHSSATGCELNGADKWDQRSTCRRYLSHFTVKKVQASEHRLQQG